ncbi:FAD-dependent oxidoreductase [[Clostridium] symbiosum]|uniref:NAD(P)/FAD-dependent oxidoreductase n=1 Tax=Clostridium symbiosum TaxID=1512 RepID=UPI001D07D736|nr:FAD-dependent oxidoreductase [[Clostridium] symbiosum]MCB6607322.1 FAD-dependent oxidoreductase [[Clostridium] symbiosum]MCB6930122.1 FAD-dependent oxidoreductase [[Clostridium] symbiosum]
MIRINQLKLPVNHTEADLKKKAARMMRIPEDKILSLTPVRQSLDARKKNELLYIYSLNAAVSGKESAVIKNAKNVNVLFDKEKAYCFPKHGEEPLKERPVIIGFGPAGMFCGLMLARAGFAPLILERGEDVDSRAKRVNGFWAGGALNPESNVQFGEGGAGTFSDGKLNTLVKDPSGRNKKVLEILAEAGADPSITYVNKPHVGTDVLSLVVKNIRQEIIRLGGEIRFNCKMTDFTDENGQLTSITASQRQEDGSFKEEIIPAQAVVLAIGHSARDTFAMLAGKELDLQAKAFAVGLRIQHPQSQINLSQYGMENPGSLGAASYKLTKQTSSGRGVYSFCMCPGGFVVNASSEEGRLAVNGMSNHDRAGKNANSALIVTVTPEDFPDNEPLGGVSFQRNLEEAAYRAGNGKIPIQLYKDFKKGAVSDAFGDVEPAFKGGYSFANLRDVMPEPLSDALIEGINSFGRIISGFDRDDAILAGIESRTSSPVRIPRDEGLESRVRGLYPCGEGAGYAGGITSAAMDGLRAAETIVSRFSSVFIS